MKLTTLAKKIEKLNLKTFFEGDLLCVNGEEGDGYLHIVYYPEFVDYPYISYRLEHLLKSNGFTYDWLHSSGCF